MRTSLTFRPKVSIPDLIPNRDEGLSNKGIGMRLITVHFNTFSPSDGRGKFEYAQPINQEDENTGFYCARSGFWFPGRMKAIDPDGRIVGTPFLRE